MKVLLTATVQSHIAQFHKPLVEVLHNHGCEVHVAAKDNLAEKNGLKIDFVEKVYNVPFHRSPKSLDNIKAYKQLRKIIKQENYDVIHTNTPMGGIVTRLAALGTNATVIYTAHGFHFYKGASKKSWLVFYPIEKFFSRITDKLITINHEDYQLASNKFYCKTYYIHGVGVDENRYYPCDNDTKLELKKELGYSSDSRLILCIGELLPNKNQQMAIHMIDQIKDEFPTVKLLLAGNGPRKEELENLIHSLHLENHVEMLGYCTYLEKYQQIADLSVSCSKREGLPLNIVEAMLSDNPVVATKNRGHCELIEHDKTGYLVDVDDVDSMSKYVKQLLENSNELEKMGKDAHEFAMQYSFSTVKKELEMIYFSDQLLKTKIKEFSEYVQNNEPIVREKLWSQEQEILDVFADVCRKNNLRYVLAYGTLIGAIRHNGFIPWDDDIDVMMPREDYNQLLKIWNRDAPSSYIIQDYNTDHDAMNNFAKVRKDKSTYLQFEIEKDTKYHKGIFIDIFPGDRIPSNKVQRIIQFAACATNLLYTRGWKSHTNKVFDIFEGILLHTNKENYVKRRNKVEKVISHWNNTNNSYIFANTISDSRVVFPKDLFDNLELHEFNGRQYLIPHNYDEILRLYYGDYMKLPPKEDRIWKHYPLIIDFDHNFEDLF